MCQDRHSQVVRVWVRADLSHTGASRWKDVAIDACIAPIVVALQAYGINMTGSCCGHGKAEGWIDLQDGRQLIVRRNGTT